MGERRASVDLAAGLRCSSSNRVDEDGGDIDLPAGFSHFRTASAGA
jgi:hypothetical protein